MLIGVKSFVWQQDMDTKDPSIVIHLIVQGKLGLKTAIKKCHRELGIGEVWKKVSHIIWMAPKKEWAEIELNLFLSSWSDDSKSVDLRECDKIFLVIVITLDKF